MLLQREKKKEVEALLRDYVSGSSKVLHDTIPFHCYICQDVIQAIPLKIDFYAIENLLCFLLNYLLCSGEAFGSCLLTSFYHRDGEGVLVNQPRKIKIKKKQWKL